MLSSQKRQLIRIAAAAALYGAATALLYTGAIVSQTAIFAAFGAAYLFIGYDVLWRALKNVLHGQILDENFLMAIASLGAMALREYPEAVAVMLFYQVGEWFQDYAVNRSRKSIGALMELRPDSANVLRDGKIISVPPSEVGVGEIISVRPGERIPLDGVIESGNTQIDASALTGESLPRDAGEGMEVLSGCVNKSGLITIRVSKPYEESSVAKILELVENAVDKKTRSEKFITRFSRYYTPIVVICALLLAIVPPLILRTGFAAWIERALIFLVVSCPCALVISVPLSFFGGIGGASKNGILVKGSNYLESLALLETVVFDKTGTLTRGVFKVVAVHPDELSEAKLLDIAAHAEGFSSHPIAQSILEAYGRPLRPERVSEVSELAGLGLTATVDEMRVCVGNAKYMEELSIPARPCRTHGTIVHIAVNGRYEGHIVISDEIKPTSKASVEALKKMGVKQAVMLTGDHKDVGERVAAEVGVDEVWAELLPQGKTRRVEQLLNMPGRKGALAFVGDGINDAPVLMRADIGIAMGALGSDAAIEAADIVLMDDDPMKIALSVRIARKTVRIVRQNVVFALGVKFLILILGSLGYASMWSAVFADVGVMILAIINAMRTLRVKGGKQGY